MRKLLFLSIAMGTIFCTQAQVLKPVKDLFKPAKKAPGTFEDSLTKIILDYKSNFTHLAGKPLPSQGESDMFQSKISMPGSLHCYVVRYHSVEDNSSSWQAIMYTGNSYAAALRKYKGIFAQIRGTEINGIGNEPAVFEGKLDHVDENVRFATSSLRLKTTDTRYKNFVADVEMSSSYEGWEVHVNLYSKPAEEPEQ